MKDKLKYYYMNTAEKLDAVIDIYKKSIGPQIGLAIIFNIIFTVIMAIAVFFGVVMLFMSAFASFDMDNISISFIISLVIFFLVVLSIALIKSATYGTGNRIMALKAYIGEKINISQVIKQSFKGFFYAFTAIIAELIVLIPLLVLLSGAFVLYFYIFYNTVSSYWYGIDELLTITIISTIIFFIIIIALTVIASTITITVLPVAVFEKKHFFSAFSKGFRLVKKDFLKICGLVTIYTLVIMAASYSFSSLWGVGAGLANIFLPRPAAAGFMTVAIYLDYFVSIISALIFTPLSGILSTVIYVNQKIKYEGLDIELKVIELQKEEQMKKIMKENEEKRAQFEQYQRANNNMPK